jgi:hypothetical protein
VHVASPMIWRREAEYTPCLYELRMERLHETVGWTR